MEKIQVEMEVKAVKELTLALMYLTRFSEKNRFYTLENIAWKGYPFKGLSFVFDNFRNKSRSI